MDKVSVVVPIYKVEQYLEKCINSILNQTYKNLEIILVDNSSPDNCGKICDEYAKKDDRIVVIHKPFGSLCENRNVGIKKSTGKYIALVDSDDWIDENHIENLMKFAAEDTIPCCGYKMIYENSIDVHNADKEASYSTKEFIQLLERYEAKSNCFSGINPYGNYIWNKLFPRKCFDDVLFIPDKAYEDIWIILHLLKQVKKVVVNGTPSYNYLQRRNSAVHTKSKKSQIDWVEGRLSQEPELEEYGGEILRDGKVLTILSAVGTFIHSCRGHYDLNSDEVEYLHSLVPERLKYLNREEIFSKAGRRILLFTISPKLLKMVLKK